MSKRWIVAVAVIAMGVAACGGSDDAQAEAPSSTVTTTTVGTETESAATETTEAPPAEDAEEPSSAGPLAGSVEDPEGDLADRGSTVVCEPTEFSLDMTEMGAAVDSSVLTLTVVASADLYAPLNPAAGEYQGVPPRPQFTMDMPNGQFWDVRIRIDDGQHTVDGGGEYAWNWAGSVEVSPDAANSFSITMSEMEIEPGTVISMEMKSNGNCVDEAELTLG